MDMKVLVSVLGWSALLNFVVLLFWFVIFMFAENRLYRIFNSFFSLSQERFNTINFLLMGAFKMGIFLFLLAPYIALRILGY